MGPLLFGDRFFLTYELPARLDPVANPAYSFVLVLPAWETWEVPTPEATSGRPRSLSGRPPPLPFRPAWFLHPPRLWFCGGLLAPVGHGTKCPACRWGYAPTGGRWPGRAAPGGPGPHGAHGGGFVRPG